MKLIGFVIFIFIVLNSISSKYSNPSDIFNLFNLFKKSINRENFIPNKTKPINSDNKSSLEDLEEQYDLNKDIFIKGIKPLGPPIRSKYRRTKYTGIKGISCHKDLGLKNGSLFMSICVKVGFTSDKQILAAHKWATKNKYITKDNKIILNNNEFVKKISEIFPTNYHYDYEIKSKKGHFYVVDSKGNEIFNSGGIRYQGKNKKRL